MKLERNNGKQRSMIRQFQAADWLTLGNAVCGMGAVLNGMAYLVAPSERRIVGAGILVFAALVLDILDGRVARWRRAASEFGRELDSLADVISFGVAPAAIAYAAGMQGVFDVIILVYFVSCGVSRLARYNVTAEHLSVKTGKVDFFEGTPIPTSAVLVGLLAVAACMHRIDDRLWLGTIEVAGGRLHPLTLLFAISGSLMISRLRISKL